MEIVGNILLFQKMWPSIQYGLKYKMGDELTEEVETAWKCVFNYIVFKMAEGIAKKWNETGNNQPFWRL